MKRVSVTDQKYSDVALCRPKDDFWPIERYRRKYGSPSANRKLKHKKVTIDGIVGVVVPGDDGDGPWALERKSGRRTMHDEDLEVGSSDGEEAVASTVFQHLRNEEESFFADIAQGALQEVLKEYELDEAGKEKEETRRKRRKMTRRKKQLEGDAKPKSTSFFREAESGDEDDEAERTEKLPKRPALRGKAKAKATCAVASSSSPAAKHGDGPGGLETPTKQGSGGGGTEAAGHTDPGSASRGAPKKDAVAMATGLWEEFGAADARSLYFNKSSDVQRRLVIRWANTCRSKAGSASRGADKVAFEVAAKRLQVIESVIKMHRAWTYRSTSAERAYDEFEASWKALEQFMAADPQERLHCPFFSEFRLQLKAIGQASD